MFNEIAVFVSGFWMIFSFSFLVALTGAIAPGPLLTYTIVKSAKTTRQGYLMGVWIVIGHALIEFCIIFALLSGLSFVLKNPLIVRSIGIVGGIILCFFGLSIITDVKRGTVQSDFLRESDTDAPASRPGDNDPEEGEGATGNSLLKRKLRRMVEHPVIGGMLVSMANPYWWIWWATIGFAFMVQFEVSMDQWPKLLAFFIGHEMGDLVWYLFVSILSFYGVQYLSRKVYHGVLSCCGVFMIGFGVYLGVMPFFK